MAMMEYQERAVVRVSAIFALKVLSQTQGMRFSGEEAIEDDEHEPVCIVRLGERANITLAALDATYAKLVNLSSPFIVLLADGTYRTVLSISKSHAEVRRIDRPSAHVVTRAAFEDRWSGKAFVATGVDGSVAKVSWSGLLLEQLTKYQTPIVHAAIISGLVHCLALCTPITVLLVIDKVINHNGLDTLDVLVAGLVVVCVFEFVLSLVRESIVRHVAIQIDVELGSRLYSHVTGLPLAWFVSKGAGEVAATFSDLGRVKDFLAVHSAAVVMDVGFALAFLVVLYVMHSGLALIVAISLPVYALVAVLTAAVQRRRVEERERRSSANHTRLVETLTGIESVKSMGLERDFRERWNRELSEYAVAAERTHRTASLSGQGMELVNRLSVAAILWFGTNAVVGGEMTLGQFIAFNLIAMRLSAPILRVTHYWRGFQQIRYAAERINRILEVEQERNGSTAPAGRSVEFRDVSFRYPGAAGDTVSHLDFVIPENAVVGLVGKSGSGKSTILRLAQGLHLPNAGVLRLGGVDVREVDRAVWRRRMGVMVQDDVLFARSVAENIAVGDPSMSWERIVRAARLAGAHGFVVDMPRGYNTLGGERGCTLSGGQRQRLVLARALAGDPDLLLLDEPTAALDSESEVRFRECLTEIAENRTVVVSTHRLRLLRDADVIVVVDSGRIVEIGQHGELMSGGGVYARLAGQEHALL